MVGNRPVRREIRLRKPTYFFQMSLGKKRDVQVYNEQSAYATAFYYQNDCNSQDTMKEMLACHA
uniref:Transposase n=1 Tax=Romanomermis culicivorax TaxID=13658 RepID=A0A915KIT2_ROMCU